jgi:hypothetical protein
MGCLFGPGGGRGAATLGLEPRLAQEIHGVLTHGSAALEVRAEIGGGVAVERPGVTPARGHSSPAGVRDCEVDAADVQVLRRQVLTQLIDDPLCDGGHLEVVALQWRSLLSRVGLKFASACLLVPPPGPFLAQFHLSVVTVDYETPAPRRPSPSRSSILQLSPDEMSKIGHPGNTPAADATVPALRHRHADTNHCEATSSSPRP